MPPASFASSVLGWLIAFAEAAVVLALALGVVTVIALVILRWPPLRGKIREQVRKRAEPPRWLSWLAGTALHLGAFTASPEAGDAQALAAVLSAQLGGAGARRPMAGVDLATTPYRTSSVLEDIAEAVKGLPNGKALAALIKLAQKLLPRGDLYLTGYLLRSSERGAGLVLSIVSDSGHVKSSGILWSDILEPAGGADQAAGGDVLRLAIAGAVWAQFELLAELSDSVGPHSHTVNWRSAALFEVAVHDEGSRDSHGLRALYALALDRDPDNLPALYNLAVLELHAGLAALACMRLRTLRDALAQEGASSQTTQVAGLGPAGGAAVVATAHDQLWHDPLYYQAHYTLAVALQAPARARAANVAPWLYDVARELEVDIGETSAQIARWRSDLAEPRSLRDAEARLDTLKRIEGPLLVLLAIERQGQLERAGFKRMGDLSVGGQLAPTPFTREQLLATLAAWEQAPPSSAARSKRELDPQTLAFGHVAGESPEVSYRVHYNRACYAAFVAERLTEQAQRATSKAQCTKAKREAGEALDWALAKLECALEPGDLAEWASNDRALAFLKQQRTDAFAALLGSAAAGASAAQPAA
jgi:hypothetical protein